MFISVHVVRSVLAELESRGHDVSRLLRAASLDRVKLSTPSEGVRELEFARLIKQALLVGADPVLALSVGLRAPAMSLHVIGVLLLASTSIREAVDSLERYGGLLADGVDWRLSETGDVASLEISCAFVELDQGCETTHFLVDLFIGHALRVGRQFATAERPLEVLLTRAEPSCAKVYRALTGCPVRYDAKTNAVTFRRALVERPQPHADPLLCAALRRLAEDFCAEGHGAGGYSARVGSVLRFETNLAAPDWPAIARRWELSHRALRSRVAREGQSLSELLDDARRKRAIEELSRPFSEIKAVSESLGYSEQSAFHRAFKRWTGYTPGSFKEQVRTGDHVVAHSPQARSRKPPRDDHGDLRLRPLG